MPLTKNELYLLKEVFTKVKCDKLNERYYIALEDYGFLKLDPPQLILLKNMCKKNNIYLEELPKRLKGIETQELFEKYNKIKEQVEIIQNEQDTKKLKEELIKIRETIILGHMRQVYYLINKMMPELENNLDKEDIYQTCYEILIEYFDKYNIEKDVTFSYFISEFLIYRILYKIYRNNTALGKETLTLLRKIQRAKQKLEKEEKEPSIENLIKITGIKKDKIKKILILEDIITMETTNFEEISTEESLIDYNFEENIIENIINDSKPIEKLINLLPERERLVIRLYYGFEDNNTYTYEEIAKLMNVSRQWIEQIKESGLKMLITSTGSNYLKDIYGNPKNKIQTSEKSYSLITDEKQKRDFIIGMIDHETILSIINTFHPINKEIMLLHYGLKYNKKYEVDEISKIIDLRKTEVSKNLKLSTDLLIKRIVKEENPNFKGDYFEYLINNYLNRSSKKILHI